jgi:DnaK suppressor protein
MTKREFKDLRRRLEAQLEETRRFLTSLERETRSFETNIPQDSADLSVATVSQESLFAQASQRRLQMRRIEGAIDRIDHGSFGICTNCGEPIAARRLEAVPWTQNCLQCQELIEQASMQSNSVSSRFGSEPVPSE